MVLLEKDNGILMETIGIYVMVSIGLLLFFVCRVYNGRQKQKRILIELHDKSYFSCDVLIH